MECIVNLVRGIFAFEFSVKAFFNFIDLLF